jgi:hypothetical protein
MSIDQRKKMLKNLRKTNYDVFEKTCRELDIEYTFPPQYYRKAHHRFLIKKALCIQVCTLDWSEGRDIFFIYLVGWFLWYWSQGLCLVSRCSTT